MILFTGSIWMDAICVLVAVVVAIYSYFKWVYQTWRRKNIPYFEPTIPFGNSDLLNREMPRTVDVFNIVQKAKEKGWNYFGLYLMMNPFFVPLDLDMVKNILIRDFNSLHERGIYYNEKDDPMSGHLFAIGGQKWKNLRTKLSPTFTSGKLKAMFSSVTSGCSILEKTLEEHNKNEPLDVKEVLIGFTMDTIGSCAFGIETNNAQDYDSSFRKYGQKFFEKTAFEQMYELFTDAFPRLSRALHMKVMDTDVSRFFHDFVSSTVTYREKQNYKRNDFLQLLIDMKSNETVENRGDGLNLTMNEIVAQSFVFFVAGYETTSTTMTFVFYEISNNQKIQEKLRDELFTVLKKHDNNVSYDVLKELEYMQQVIDETLRKYPPVPFITRECTEDYKIPNLDICLEKGTKILIPISNIHYEERIYDDPHKFDPDRFSPEQKKHRHPCAYIPFGEGPRICIGLRFALMEVKLTLLKILTKFRITLNPKTKVPLQLDRKSFIPLVKGGIWVNLEKL